MHRELIRLRELLREAAPAQDIVVTTPEDILQKPFALPKGQRTLFDFENPIKLIVDTRELASDVVAKLSAESSIGLLARNLEIGDYVISDRVCVERKVGEDFLQSIIDGRLWTQLNDLSAHYPQPLLVVEGVFDARSVHRNALFGALASALTDFNVSVVFTKNADETAKLLEALARREFMAGREPRLRTGKPRLSLPERQQYILEGLPNVSAVLAQRLLARFGSPRAVLTASLEQLMSVKGIGKKKALEIIKALTTDYYSALEEVCGEDGSGT
jgi:Fanconi anemia group M protein